jgi:hypothetical protein
MGHDIVSWVGCIGLLYGLHLIGLKRIDGFYIALASEGAWIAWGIAAHAWALVAMSLAICVMYLRAIAAWRKAPPQ